MCSDLRRGRRDLPRSVLVCFSVVADSILIVFVICLLVLAICLDLYWSDLIACDLFGSALICILAIAICPDARWLLRSALICRVVVVVCSDLCSLVVVICLGLPSWLLRPALICSLVVAICPGLYLLVVVACLDLPLGCCDLPWSLLPRCCDLP